MRLLGAVLVAGSFALTGHAASAAPWLAAPALGVHALYGAFWLASLLPLLWYLRLALTRRTWHYGGSRPRPRPPSPRSRGRGLLPCLASARRQVRAA